MAHPGGPVRRPVVVGGRAASTKRDSRSEAAFPAGARYEAGPLCGRARRCCSFFYTRACWRRRRALNPSGCIWRSEGAAAKNPASFRVAEYCGVLPCRPAAVRGARGLPAGHLPRSRSITAASASGSSPARRPAPARSTHPGGPPAPAPTFPPSATSSANRRPSTPSRGVFPDHTWRMHPDICAFHDGAVLRGSAAWPRSSPVRRRTAVSAPPLVPTSPTCPTGNVGRGGSIIQRRNLGVHDSTSPLSSSSSSICSSMSRAVRTVRVLP